MPSLCLLLRRLGSTIAAAGFVAAGGTAEGALTESTATLVADVRANASDATDGGGFGAAADVDESVGAAVIGSAAGAYVWRWQGGTSWTEEAKLSSGEATFGQPVAISGDYAAVAAERSNTSGAVLVFGRNQGGADNWGLVKMVVAPDAAASDYFGRAVALQDDTLFVGSILDDDLGAQSGSVYVFRKDTGGADNWGFLKKITASDGAANDNFGSEVKVSGATLAVSAPYESGFGAVYVLERNLGGTDNWGESRKIVPSNGASGDLFGRALGLKGDLLAVGAPGKDSPYSNAGAVYVFERNAGGAANWGQQKYLVAYDNDTSDYYGNWVSLTDKGMLAVGAPYNDQTATYAGAVYVYDADRGGPANWGLRRKLVARDANQYDYFGYGLAAWSDDFVLVGCAQRDLPIPSGTGAGVAFFCHLQETPQLRITADDGADYDRFGEAAAMSNDGTKAAVAAPYADSTEADAGAVRVYEKDGAGAWAMTDLLGPRDDDPFGSLANSSFGHAAAFSADGGSLFVGAPFEKVGGVSRGRVYLFRQGENPGDPWSVDDVYSPSGAGSDDAFGYAVSVDETHAAVSAPGYFDPGTVYLFEHDGLTSWTLSATLPDPDPAPTDAFGGGLALSGDTLAVGAPNDDEAASDSGAAYVYERSGTTWTLIAKIPNPDPGFSGGERFGQAVALSDSKGILLVGAPSQRIVGTMIGAVFVYRRSQDGSAWNLAQTIYPREGGGFDPTFNFGESLAMSPDGHRVLVGMSSDEEGGLNAGGAFLWEKDADGTYRERLKFVPSDNAYDNMFGAAVAMAGEEVLITAPGNGTVAPGAGAAYVFSADMGYERRIGASDATLTFPLTEDSNVTITLTGAAPGGRISVSRISPLPAAPSMFRNPQSLVDEVLRIRAEGAGSFTAAIDWKIDPANAVRLGALPVDQIYRFRGDEHLGTFTPAEADGVLTVNGVTGFSDWYAGNAAAVPVQISAFGVE